MPGTIAADQNRLSAAGGGRLVGAVAEIRATRASGDVVLECYKGALYLLALLRVSGQFHLWYCARSAVRELRLVGAIT
jgi:hypothetical protein